LTKKGGLYAWCLSVKHGVITHSDAALGLAVLAPLTRSLHVIRLPDGPVGWNIPVPAHLSPASLRALLADSFCSALRNARPRAAPACWPASVCAAGKGIRERTAAFLQLQRAPCLRPQHLLCCRGLFAALRRKRCARSRSQGCDRQFGQAWMAVPERSARHDVAAEGTAKRREDGPAAEEVQGPAPTAHTRIRKGRHFEKTAALTDWH